MYLELPTRRPQLAVVGQRYAVEIFARIFAGGYGGKAFVETACIVILEGGSIRGGFEWKTLWLPQELTLRGNADQRRHLAAKFW